MLTYVFKLHPTPEQVSKLVALCLYQRDLYNELIGWAEEPFKRAMLQHGGDFKAAKASKPERRWSHASLTKHLTELRQTPSFASYRIAIQRSACAEIEGAVKAVGGGNRMPGKRRECRSFGDTDPNGRNPLAGEGRYRVAHINTGLDDLDIRCTVHREPEGTVRKWSVKAERWPGFDKSGRRCNGDNGRWLLCLTTDASVRPAYPTSDEAVGVDPGVRTLLTCSDGRTYENPAYGVKAAARLDAVEAERDKMKNQRRGTKKRRLGQLFTRLAAKVARQRKHNAFCVARDVMTRYAFVAIEDSSGDIGTAEEKGRKKLHRAARDAAWGMITSRMEQLAPLRVRRIDPAYTTQDCSACGHRAGPQGANEWFDCPACGAHIGRDLNASRNILARSQRHD